MLPMLIEHILLRPSWGETEFVFAELMIKSLLDEGGDATVDLASKIQQRLLVELRRN